MNKVIVLKKLLTKEGNLILYENSKWLFKSKLISTVIIIPGIFYVHKGV